MLYNANKRTAAQVAKNSKTPLENLIMNGSAKPINYYNPASKDSLEDEHSPLLTMQHSSDYVGCSA